MEWINYAVSVLSGLAVAIPLVVKLVEYVKKAVKENNSTGYSRYIKGMRIFLTNTV